MKTAVGAGLKPAFPRPAIEAATHARPRSLHPLAWPSQGHSHYYENSRATPYSVVPVKTGTHPRTHGIHLAAERRTAPVFIPQCGLHKAIVIPNVAQRSEESKSESPSLVLSPTRKSGFTNRRSGECLGAKPLAGGVGASPTNSLGVGGRVCQDGSTFS